MKRFAEQWLMLGEKPVWPACILIPLTGTVTARKRTSIYKYPSERMKYTVRNSQNMYSFELFKYVSAGQSAAGHKKHSKKQEKLLRQRGGRHLCAK